jgi:hypothetical protein
LTQYNCIAHSIDETNFVYTSIYIDTFFGDSTVGTFSDADMNKFYNTKKGWNPITFGTEKTKASLAEAMYYSYPGPWEYSKGHPRPTSGFHAARRKYSCGCGNGEWIMYESKCGLSGGIEHRWSQSGSSPSYRSPTIYYR